ncbi:hypothetical protein, partial [Pseudomonas weihenstephanensis]|uniref:hypothetical protein n=1 Tax=Pseudomonas weihenstephanensis TaxID=1608994 RepID=UPI0013016356
KGKKHELSVCRVRKRRRKRRGEKTWRPYKKKERKKKRMKELGKGEGGKDKSWEGRKKRRG